MDCLIANLKVLTTVIADVPQWQLENLEQELPILVGSMEDLIDAVARRLPDFPGIQRLAHSCIFRKMNGAGGGA